MLTVGTLGASFKEQHQEVFMGDVLTTLVLADALREIPGVRTVEPDRHAGVFHVVTGPSASHLFLGPFDLEFRLVLYRFDQEPRMVTVTVEMAVFG